MRQLTLALFFTRSVGLRTWVDNGLFDREKLIYERHLSEGTLGKVVWLTYHSGDEALAGELHRAGRLDHRIEIRGRSQWIPGGRFGGLLYSVILPLVHFDVLRQTDLLKTNQLDGGWSAVFARWLTKKPLLLRCGYVQSKLEYSLRRLPAWRLRVMMALEQFQFLHADLALVASEHNARYVQNKYHIANSCLRLLPNYINEIIFAPNLEEPIVHRPRRLVYVGRLSTEKNLETLIRAVARLNLPLDLVGQGPLLGSLQLLAKECGASVKFLGSVSNNVLPDLLNRYAFFVLPSYFEGMPKTLLEAMACGLVCIGTDVDGINEVVSDGSDGFLSQGVDEESLIITIKRAMEADIETIGRAARQTILDRYTLDAIVRIEKNIFKEL